MFSDTLNDDIIIKPDTHYRSKNKSEKRNQIYKTLASSISKEYLKFDMPLYLSSDSSIAQVFKALKIRNAFAPPFLFLCNQYIHWLTVIQNSIVGVYCNRQATTIHENSLLCKLERWDDVIDCNIHGAELREIWTNSIATMLYEQYYKSGSSTISTLHRLQNQGLYTIEMNSWILEYKKYVNFR